MDDRWSIVEQTEAVVARTPIAATLWTATDEAGKARFVVTTDKKGPTTPNANPNGASVGKREAWTLWREKQRLSKGR